MPGKPIKSRKFKDWALSVLPPSLSEDVRSDAAESHLRRWSGVKFEPRLKSPVPVEESGPKLFTRCSTHRTQIRPDILASLQSRLSALWNDVTIASIPVFDPDKFNPVRFRSHVVEAHGELSLRSLCRELWQIGLPVFYVDRPPDVSIEGVAFRLDADPAIVVFSKRNEFFGLFVVVHELGHVVRHLFGKNGHDWILDGEDGLDGDEVEEEANQFALRFLFGDVDPMRYAPPAKAWKAEIMSAASRCARRACVRPESVLHLWARQLGRNQYYGTVEKTLPRKTADVIRNVQWDYVSQGISTDHNDWAVRRILGLPALEVDDGSGGIAERHGRFLKRVDLGLDEAGESELDA